MKRIMALLLVLAMCFSLLTGCGCSRQEVIEPAPTVPEDTEPVVAYDENLDKALEYLKVHYKNADEKTAFDYDVLGNIRIGDTVYEVVWTVDVGEDIITIVVNEDGTVTIDINDDYQYNSLVETPYVLTATITGLDGRVVSNSWNRIIPPGIDEEMIAIVDAAYALKEGEALNGTQTLTGTIISVDTMYSEQYQNVTVTIVVRGREDYPIQCFRLKGAGVDKLAVGDIITVTGTLKNYYGTIEFDAGCILEDVKPGGGEPPKKPDDPAEILRDAFALKPGRSLPYNPVELTGTVTEINYDYKPGNDNMSVTINCMGYSIYCYYLYGTTSQLSNMNINDIITVKGNIKNYFGKVEFDHATITGMTNKPKPAQPSDPKQVVDDAYRLAEGSSLRYNPVTLTGKIIDFKYRYTDQYKNICPYIVIEGRENKPIYCFGLTGKGIKEVDIGDTITVRGNIKNYYGDIEFEKPTLVSYEKQKLEECPEDPAEILKDAYALEKGEMTPYVAKLTGAISSIESPYNSQYDNISVWITVEGHENQPILAYRTKGKDAKLLGIGDIIEVTGRIINYNGKIEFVEGSPYKLIKKVASVEATAEQKALEKKLAAVGKHDDGYVDSEVITVVGTILTAPRQSSRNETQWWFDMYDGWNTITCYYVPMTGYETAPMKGDKISVTGKLVARSGTGQFTEDTATAKWLESGGLVAPELPDADSTLTIPEAQEAAMAAGSGYSSGKYYVKGKIKEIADSEYGNMTIVDADGNELYIYGTYSKDGKTPYSALPEKPVVGKTYTFYGVLGTFNNIPQMRNGWIQELDNKKLDYTKIPADGSTLTIPKANEVAEFAGAIYTDPYKYYVTGKIKDVTADQYGNMTIVDNKGNELYIYGTWTEGGEVRYGKVTGEKPGVGDEITVYGVLGTFNKTVQMKNGWIVGLKAPEDSGSDVKDPVVAVPNPAESAATKVANGTYVIWYAGAESNLAATALEESKTYGYLYNPVNVTLSGNKLSGYSNANIFTITNNSDGTFTMKDCYGRTMYMSENHNTFAVAEGAQDADDWKLFKAADGTYYIKNVAKDKFVAYDPAYSSYGAYNDRSAGYILHLTAVAAGSGTEQEKVEEPADGSTLTIVEANELGKAFAHNTYTEGSFYVTGTVSQIVKDDYGNLYIADKDGNTLYIYGSYSEDGNTRYDGLENPPKVGDTITVYGKLGTYSGAVQMKNAKIQGATAAGGDEGGDDPVVQEPAADSVLTIPQATELGKSKASGATTTNKYYVTGVIKNVYNTQYGNMYIQDEAGNELQIYGTYDATGATRYDAMTTKPVVGDTVKLYGVIGNYNGNAQMVDAWVIEHTPGEGGGDEGGDDPVVQEPAADSVLTLPQATELGKSKAHDTTTTNKYYVTGVIKSLTSTTYGNMYIQDEAGNELQIYGTYDATGANRYDAMTTKPVVGDTVKLYGVIGNYNGNAQMKNAWIVEHTPAGGEGGGDEGGDDPVVQEPAADSVLTIPQATELGKSKASGATTTNKYYVTGVIKNVYNTQYGNMYIQDEAGNELQIYGTYDATGATRYDAMTTKPVAGDTVKLYGVIGNYNGNAQMVDAWVIEHTPGEGGGDEGGDSGDTGDDTDVAAAIIDLSNKDNRTSYSATQQVWEQNGITVTNDKAASGSDVGDYAPARFYQSSSLTISYPGMTKIVIDCDGSGIQEKHITAWKTSYPDAVVSGTTVTITLAAAQDTFTIESFVAQARAASISVYTDAGDEGGDDPAPTVSTGTLSFATTADRNSFSTTEQVWSANGITFTNTKTSASSNVADYFNPVRCYKSSDISIDCAGMTQIVFNCSAAEYATSLAGAIGNVTADGNTVTVVLDPAQDSFEVSLSVGKVFLNSITVTGTGVTGSGSGDTDDSGDSGDSGNTNLPAMPTENQKATLADGTYVIYNAATMKAATAYDESKTYGYLTGTTVTVGGEYDSTVIFTITNNSDGTFTLTDCYGRILYMDANYTNFNAATSAIEGDDWQLYTGENGTYYIKNVLKEKYVAYSAEHGSFGSYEDMREGTLLTIIPVNAESGDDSGDDETKPVIAGPFYLGVYKANDEIALYFNGAMDTSKNYYLGTTTDATKAVKVYTETLDGAVKIYFMNGNTKTYIETYVSGTYVNNQLVTEPTMSYTWDASIGTYTVVLNVDGTDTAYYLGTYANNKGSEIRPSKTSFITAENLGVEQFVIKLVENAEDLIPEGAGDETPDKPEAEIVDEAFALQTGAALSQKVTLTGKVTAIDFPFSPSNNNVSVIMEVFGTDGKAKSLDCFRLTGEDIVLIKVGDIITVNGIISRYDESTVQFNAGSTLVKLTESDGTEKTLDSVVKLTNPQEIIDEAFNLSNYEVIPYEVSLTGKVTNVGTYDTSYKNVTVKIEVEGKTIECYRLSGDGADQIAVGDTITVTGYLCNYGGTVEFLQGCTFTKVVTLNVENDKVESAPPVEEPPVEETPVEEVPVEEAPVEETPTVEAPAEEIPVEETPVEVAPVEEVPVVDPVVEVPAEENAA